MTYYETLEVSITSSHEDIKKSYKLLAKKWHPDTPTGNEEKFKTINEAYSILSDKQKRANYDATLSRVPRFNFQDDFMDTFNNFNTNFRENLDVERSIRVSFKESYYGSKVSVQVYSNEIQEFFLPRGITDGTKVVLEGKGQYSKQSNRYGNLNVKVFVDNDENVRRVDLLDIEIINDINVFKLFQDTSIEVKLWDEKLGNVKIPLGTDISKRIRIQGRGITNGRTKVTGDLYIRLNVITPSIDELPESLVNEINKYIGVTNGTK